MTTAEIIKKVPKKSTGRPTVMNEATLNKLEEVFAIGGSDKEACFYAGISHQTLYDYQEKNPTFIERKEALKERPILKARQTVVKSLDTPSDAQWFLERRRKDEFGKASEEPTKVEKNTTYNFIQNTTIQAEIKTIEDAIKAKLLSAHETPTENK